MSTLLAWLAALYDRKLRRRGTGIPKGLCTHIKDHEGYCAVPYEDDRGNRTIGFGHRILHGERFPHALSQLEAEELMRADLRKTCAFLDRNMPWWRDMNAVRQGALAEMGYQMGGTGLLKFAKTLPLLRDGQYTLAAAEAMDSRWAREYRTRALHVTRRMRFG